MSWLQVYALIFCVLVCLSVVVGRAINFVAELKKMWRGEDV